MKSMFFFVFCFLQTLSVYTQEIVVVENRYYNEQDFQSFDILCHAATGTRFELGVFYPQGYQVVYDTNSNRSYYKIVDTIARNTYNNLPAKAYLKSTKESAVPEFISLQIVDDLELLRFTALSSDSLVLYQNRYTFGIYDLNTQKASPYQQPGAFKYEGEDAISALLGGFSFFDNEKFLFGHVQAYGIFCYDISNPARPIELRRYALSENSEGVYYNNQGEHHVFLYLREGGTWDVLLARSDTSTQSLTRLYGRFKEIMYITKDVSIKLDDEAEPDVAVDSSGIVQIQLTDDTGLSIKLSQGSVAYVKDK